MDQNKNEWIETAVEAPPEDLLVETKIDDSAGVRNIEVILKRGGGLWFFESGRMHVYYTPTHWRKIDAGTSKAVAAPDSIVAAFATAQDAVSEANLATLTLTPWQVAEQWGWIFVYSGTMPDSPDDLLGKVLMIARAPASEKTVATFHFAALSRNVLDIQMRRGWEAEQMDSNRWRLNADSLVYLGDGYFEMRSWALANHFADPFTCLDEAEKYFLANVKVKV